MNKQISNKFKLTAALIQLTIEYLDELVPESEAHIQFKEHGIPLQKYCENFLEGVYQEKEVRDTNTLPMLTSKVEKSLIKNQDEPINSLKYKLETVIRKNT